MVASKTEIQSQAVKLAEEAFETFCEDIAAMFDIEMDSTPQEPKNQKLSELKKEFKKLVAINSVKTHGALDGNFNLIFDKDGLFTLAGVIVMLPENRILENRRKGAAKEAEEMSDSFGEAGNLLVGSWDRIFRENLEGHGHFVQTDTFIGNPWDNTEKNIGLADDTEILFIPYQMTIGSYPTFNCGIIFPNNIFNDTSADETEDTSTEEQQPEPEPQAVDAEKEVAVVEETTPQPEKTDTAEQKIEPEKPAPPVEQNAEKENPPAATEQPQTPQPVANQPEPAVTNNENSEPVSGEISETIERMTSSSAKLPGESPTKFSAIKAQDIMQKQLLWGTTEDSVQQAMTKMQQAGTGYMIVGANGLADGIVSNHDIAAATSIYLKPMFAKWRRPLDDATLQIKVKWIMTKPAITLKPETSLTTILENMQNSASNFLTVVDQQGKTIGLVTAFDIFKAILNTDSDIPTVEKTPQTSAPA